MTELRDKDHVILEKISEGLDDTQKITSETTLQNHEVRYSLKKLEQLNLIAVNKPDHMVERVVDGQKRVFQHPLQAQPTEKGLQILKQSEQEGLGKYENLTHDELVEKVHRLEEQVCELEQTLRVFREQVQRSI
jgi:predicted transcriptional regulator